MKKNNIQKFVTEWNCASLSSQTLYNVHVRTRVQCTGERGRALVGVCFQALFSWSFFSIHL